MSLPSHELLAKMTDEEIDEAIAKKIGCGKNEDVKVIEGRWYCSAVASWDYPPRFTKDLNAMHEAEKTLNDTGDYSQRNYYACILGGITYNDNGRGWQPLSNDDCFPICHATARQRAEAFLHVVSANDKVEGGEA